MARRGVTRRGFGRALGAAALAAPFYRWLGGGAEAHAQAGPQARRLLVVFTPNGTIHQHWRPTGTGRSYAFAPGSILEPLAAHRAKLLVLDGIDFVNASNHEGGMAAMLTGNGGAGSSTQGMSVDQFVASRIGGDTPFASLELGVQTSAWGGGTQTRISYGPGGVYVPPDDDPRSVYRRLFGSVSGEPAEVDENLRRQRSILDLCLEELDALHRRVPAEERPKLEEHMDAIRRLEQGLSVSGGGGVCDVPEAVTAMDVYANDNFPAIGRAQTDLLVAALACDLTRVASLQWSHTVGPTVFSWLGVSDGHHSLSHYDPSNPRGVSDYVACERWFAEQFAYLLDRLEATSDPLGGGSLFDNTLVVWAQELGDGRMHECISVPFVLAGGANAYFDFGRYIDFGSVAHQHLLVSICQAMGVQTQTFGDASVGSGPLAGLV